MEEARSVVSKALDRTLSNGNADWNKIKSDTKDTLGNFIRKKTKRNPMILPIIMEV